MFENLKNMLNGWVTNVSEAACTLMNAIEREDYEAYSVYLMFEIDYSTHSNEERGMFIAKVCRFYFDEVAKHKPIKIEHMPDIDIYVYKRAETMLNYIIEKMPNGKFINNHNGEEDICSGVIITIGGDICPIFNGHSCMNPLLCCADNTVHLSTYSINAPNFNGIDSINPFEEYNKDCIRYKNYGACIVAYHLF